MPEEVSRVNKKDSYEVEVGKPQPKGAKRIGERTSRNGKELIIYKRAPKQTHDGRRRKDKQKSRPWG